MYADRVKDTTATTGTGAITLVGSAPTGYQTFATAFGASPMTVSYCIADQSGPNWEVGTGTFNGTTGLTRTTVLASSNAGSLVNFTAGTKDVFCTAPAKYLDAFTSTNQGAVPASGGGTTNFLRADGSFAAPPTTAPAGADTQVQYNSAGAFGANANFAYTVGTNTLTVSTLTSPSGALTVTPFAPAAGTAPAALNITGAASQDANNGGVVNITGGIALTPSTGVGGSILITGANSSAAGGGAVAIRGGQGATSGGGFTFGGGAGSSTTGGNFLMTSGTGVTASGSFSIGSLSGGSTGNSGGITLSTGGSGLLSGTTGSFTFTSGNQTNAGTSGSFNVNIGTSATGTGGSIILRPGSGTTKGSTRLRSSLATDVIQITDNGTNQIGFFGATPVVKQTTGGTPTGAYTLNDVIAALQAYGLLV